MKPILRQEQLMQIRDSKSLSKSHKWKGHWRAEPAGRGCPAFAIFSSELVSNYPASGLDYFYGASRSEGIQVFTTQTAQKIEIGCLDEFRASWCLLCAFRNNWAGI